MSNKRTTPDTDAAENLFMIEGEEFGSVWDFCRNLERDRDQHKETIRKMNRYCAELEEHFRAIGRIVVEGSGEHGLVGGGGMPEIVAICQEALGDTGLRCFWEDSSANV